MSRQVSTRKKRMLAALEQSLGVVTVAARTAKIDRTLHYIWMKQDPEYKQAVMELDNVALDFAESQLHKQIKDGIPSSTIFYLKTRGKERGYIERYEHQVEEKPIFTAIELDVKKQVEEGND